MRIWTAAEHAREPRGDRDDDARGRRPARGGGAAGGARLRQGVRRPRPRLRAPAARLPHRAGRLHADDRSSACGRLTDDPDHLAEAMGFFNAWMFAWIETIERQLTERLHGRARAVGARRGGDARGRGAGAARRRARSTSPRSASGSATSSSAEHVGYVVWSESVRRARRGRAARCSARWSGWRPAVAEALGARSRADRRRRAATWPAGRGGASPSDLDDLRAAAGRARRRALGWRRGSPGHGVEGFVRSHREALLARGGRPQLRGDGSRGCVAYPDLALEALLIDDLEAARRFAERELGPLAADDDATLRLASTLRIFLEEGASFVRAARRLGVHDQHRRLPRAAGRGAPGVPGGGAAARVAGGAAAGVARELTTAIRRPEAVSSAPCSFVAPIGDQKLHEARFPVRAALIDVVSATSSDPPRAPAACRCSRPRTAGAGRRARSRSPRRSSRRTSACLRRTAGPGTRSPVGNMSRWSLTMKPLSIARDISSWPKLTCPFHSVPALSYWEIIPQSTMRALEVEAHEDLVHDLAADVLEVHVDAVRRGGRELLAPVGGRAVHAGVEAKLLDGVPALLRAARDPHRAGAARLDDLAGDRADGAAGRRDHHGLARLRLHELEPDVGGDARVAERPEEGGERRGQRIGRAG